MVMDCCSVLIQWKFKHQTQSSKKLVGYVISDHLKARIYCECTV